MQCGCGTAYQKVSDTAGEITARRQDQVILYIMVERNRIIILSLSRLAPRCEQIFPHEFCSVEFASRSAARRRAPSSGESSGRAPALIFAAVSGGFWDSSLALDDRRSGSRQPRDGIDWRKMSQHCLTPVGRLLTYRESDRAWSRLTTVRRRSSLSSADGGRPGMSVGTRGAVADDPGAVAIP